MHQKWLENVREALHRIVGSQNNPFLFKRQVNNAIVKVINNPLHFFLPYNS